MSDQVNNQELSMWTQQKIDGQGLRSLARVWDMDPATLHRDVANLQAGKPTRVFRSLVKAHMTVESLEAQVQVLKAQLAAGDQRLRSEIEELQQEIRQLKSAVEQARDMARVERAARQNASRDFLDYWIERLKAAGIIDADDDELHGDAAWIIENGVTKLKYLSLGCAAVALGPDDYKSPGCRKSLGSLRQGISPEERLNPDAGVLRPRPEFYGERNARNVGFRNYPDEPWFYGAEDYALIADWRKGYLDWKQRWKGKSGFADIFASPKRFQSVSKFVLARRELDSRGYIFYSDYREVNWRSEDSYKVMKALSFLRFFWPLSSPAIAIAAVCGGLAWAIVALGL